MPKLRPAVLNVLRLLLAWIAAVAIEWGNYALGQKTFLLPLEAVPAGAFLAGVLGGWPGIFGWSVGMATNHYVRFLQAAEAFPEREAIFWAALPISYAFLGIAGYMVFRYVGRIGRGFPDARSVVAFAAAAGVGGVLTAAATKLLFPGDFMLSGLFTHTASNFASVLFFAPPLMLVASRVAKPLLVPMPRELLPEKPFPQNLQILPSKSDVPLAG